jgi:hypothetical protein
VPSQPSAPQDEGEAWRCLSSISEAVRDAGRYVDSVTVRMTLVVSVDLETWQNRKKKIKGRRCSPEFAGLCDVRPSHLGRMTSPVII